MRKMGIIESTSESEGRYNMIASCETAQIADTNLYKFSDANM